MLLTCNYCSMTVLMDFLSQMSCLFCIVCDIILCKRCRLHRWGELWRLLPVPNALVTTWEYTHTHIHFTALFPGPPGWAGARRELDFMVQGKISRGRHTDHLAGRHCIRTNQRPPPPNPHRPDALPAAQPTMSKHWRQVVTKGMRAVKHCSSKITPFLTVCTS